MKYLVCYEICLFEICLFTFQVEQTKYNDQKPNFKDISKKNLEIPFFYYLKKIR